VNASLKVQARNAEGRMNVSETSRGVLKMETPHEMNPTRDGMSRMKRPRLLYFVGALVAGALIALLASLLIVRDNGAKASVPAIGSPASASVDQLKALAAQTDHPVYWAGAKSGAYELTRTSDGRIYVRYLPSADKVGDRAANYLTVGTYQSKNAFTAIQRAAARQGAVSVKIDNGGLLVFNESTPKSVYFSYPGATYQVEVFDPSAKQARTLVLAGKITPIK
jgi:hypothetical protein